MVSPGGGGVVEAESIEPAFGAPCGSDVGESEDNFELLVCPDFKLPSPVAAASLASSTRSRSTSSRSSCSELSPGVEGIRKVGPPDVRGSFDSSVCEQATRASRSPSFHPSSPILVGRAAVAVEWHRSAHNRRSTFCRAALIRANACRFADRYHVGPRDALVGEGSFGRVHRCVDTLGEMSRAVKRIRFPSEGSRQDDLVNEVDCLIALDHPAIVRLIEYFVEGDELLLVMELLSGPSLAEKMWRLGSFKEDFAVRCLRHMLKALFCCHCLGIAHNDVSPENFRFQTPRPDATLKMVDFGLSLRSVRDQGEHKGHYIEQRDIWHLGAIFFAMLTGESLIPATGEEELPAPIAVSEGFVLSRLQRLQDNRYRGVREPPSEEAISLLSAMLEPAAARRVTAQEALGHPLIVRSYTTPTGVAGGNAVGAPAEKEQAAAAAAMPWPRRVSEEGHCEGANDPAAAASACRRDSLTGLVVAIRAFVDAPRLKQMSLCVVAHLLGDSQAESISWLFRYIARNSWRVTAKRLEERLQENGVVVPEDLCRLFEALLLGQTASIDYIEFMAVALIARPELYCDRPVLRAAYRFLDTEGGGVVNGQSVHTLMPDLSEEECAELIREACGKEVMNFEDFELFMAPTDAAEALPTDYPMEAPAGAFEVEPSGGDSTKAAERGIVKSAPSEAFAIRQNPGIHRSTLRPYYEATPVSNVVLGLVRGSSTYARRAVWNGCAEMVQANAGCGAFFFMPNPKYHWTPEDVCNPEHSMRLVVWWIHPDFCDELQSWVSELSAGNGAAPSPAHGSDSKDGVGDPGDFGYSGVAKPKGYLHSCRDLAGADHIRLLGTLVDGLNRFLGRLLGDALQGAHVSAGFHYPVRPQYSTLHLQCRVNSGDVCPGEGRGVDLFRLAHRLREDPEVFSRDDETLFYEATANLRGALLEASARAGARVADTGPRSLVLSHTAAA